MQRFPKKMIFGIADSDLQTVGCDSARQIENAQRPMWDVFAEKKGIDRPQNGTHKYTRWNDDVNALSDLGVGAFRTSISMSRTIDREGKPNTKALKWYREYFENIKKKGISLHLCLYHWEAPEQFVKNGILDRDFLSYFLKHVEIVTEHFSDVVDYYIPINELWCVDYLSYLLGIHAPGFTNLEKFFQSYFVSLEVQSEVTRKIASEVPGAKIGIVNIHFPSYIQKQNTDKKNVSRSKEYCRPNDKLHI